MSAIMNPSESKADKLARLLAAARAMKAGSVPTAEIIGTINPISNATDLNSLSNNLETQNVDKNGNSINYNEQQLRFIETATTGKSCILIGAAGTGKTTCMRGTMESLIQSGKAGIYHDDGHKHLTSGTPGIVVVSFTRRAVANIRKNLSEDMKGNCLTIHALLEYEPEFYEVSDPITGETKKSMRFIATRNSFRPLSSSISICVIEESSMVSVEYFKELSDALPSNCQYIFLGDIQQLPPVFGSAILGYKMLELPTIELTQVYRQALESPIIRLAHRILSGKPIPATEYPEWKTPNQLTIHPWKKRIDADNALNTLAKFFTSAIDNNVYDPAEDMILIPFNKSCGTIELNKHIAQHLARKRNAPVFEIIAGFSKHYLSIGDKVLYDKEDAVITDIQRNDTYTGSYPQPESVTLDYWGFDNGGTEAEHHIKNDESGDDDIDFLLSQSVSLGSESSEDRVRQASHLITILLSDREHEIVVDTAAGVNSLLLSYALTVHKSQGSEFRKVFLTLHQSHATMIQRELLYTAVTRAKEELYIICEPDHLTKGILNQRIKGNTLAEKAIYFQGKKDTGGMK